MAKPDSRPDARLTLMLALTIIFAAGTALAYEPPERGLSAAFNYPGVVIGPDDPVDLALTIRNFGRTDDSFRITVLEKPEGWEAEIRSFSTVVTGVFLPGPDQVGLTLAASPPAGERLVPGDYHFKLRVESLDGQLRRDTDCLVAVRPRRSGGEPLAISTSHPEVRGPSDSRFSFSLEVKNHSGEDGLVELSADAPAGWEVYFKPSYEDKQVSSIQIPRGQGRTLALEVKPGYRAEPGVYPVKVRAESKWGAAGAALKVELTGTYQLRLIPANELLSAGVEAGQPVSIGFFVLNEGSAVQREVKFITVAPDNWKVTFEPEVITDLKPHQTPRPLTMTVTPPDDALVGDYGLGLVAEGERSKSPLDLRLTVRARAGWAWGGAALIALVALGLAWTFRRLGRR